jgi:hypothetical protein
MLKVQTHVQQFENICKPYRITCVILKMMTPKLYNANSKYMCEIYVHAIQ